MSGRGVDGRAAEHTNDEQDKREVEVLGEAAHFLSTAGAELVSLQLELAVLTAAVERRSGAFLGESRCPMVPHREL